MKNTKDLEEINLIFDKYHRLMDNPHECHCFDENHDKRIVEDFETIERMEKTHNIKNDDFINEAKLNARLRFWNRVL